MKLEAREVDQRLEDPLVARAQLGTKSTECLECTVLRAAVAVALVNARRTQHKGLNGWLTEGDKHARDPGTVELFSPKQRGGGF